MPHVMPLTVQEVETRLQAVRCAVCKGNAFRIDPRTSRTVGEWKGVCTGCRYTFPVHTDMEFYQQTQPDLRYLLKDIACVSCHTPGVRLDFRIVMSVREAYYFVTCQACGHAFPEQSSHESFE